MARRKPTDVPERSKIDRPGTRAFARRSKPDGAGEAGADDDAGEASEASAATPTEGAAAAPTEGAATPPPPASDAPPAAPPAPAAEPAPAPAVLAHSRTATVVMPADQALGAAPDLPGEVEDPTHMPGPREIPPGDPTDAAQAPGAVPKGDSRSLRRGTEFALVYRRQTFLISRFGVVGTRGQWRVVEYPTTGAASHGYARETSRYLSEGYSDYRG